jgi:hypothetical protein
LQRTRGLGGRGAETSRSRRRYGAQVPAAQFALQQSAFVVHEVPSGMQHAPNGPHIAAPSQHGRNAALPPAPMNAQVAPTGAQQVPPWQTPAPHWNGPLQS